MNAYLTEQSAPDQNPCLVDSLSDFSVPEPHVIDLRYLGKILPKPEPLLQNGRIVILSDKKKLSGKICDLSLDRMDFHPKTHSF